MKLLFVVFYFKIDNNTQIYNSTHFQKQITLSTTHFSQNQFYIIYSLKMNYCERKTKHIDVNTHLVTIQTKYDFFYWTLFVCTLSQSKRHRALHAKE